MSDAAEGTAVYELQSVSLLSRQPATATPTKFDPRSSWTTTVFSHLESRLTALRNWRWAPWIYWRRLAEYFLPRRYRWLVSANQFSRQGPINDAIIDSTGLMAVRTCASGLWTGLTSPSRPWFMLHVPDETVDLDDDSKAWLKNTQDTIGRLLAQSNFYTQMAQAFQDVTVFGTAVVIIYEDFDKVIRLYVPCAGEYFLGVGSQLTVDTMYREFTFTVLQIVEMFTLDNCPPDIQKLWEAGGGSLETEFVIAHAIEPNFPLKDRMPGRKVREDIEVVPGGFDWRELYWVRQMQSDRPLSKRGFREKPFMVARWSTTSNDAYGRSPCMDALGDNKQVQLETLRKAEFIEKGVRPPMGADGSLKNEPASTRPGDITYMPASDGQKKFWPLFEPNPQWLAGITADIDKVNERIKQCLFVNLFMAISQMEGVQPRNELELTKRDLERLQELGPFIELFETEFADPAIIRVYKIAQRRRLIAPMPPALAKLPIQLTYISILRLAQLAAESVSMKDTFQTGGALSAAAKSAGVPDPLRTINLDKAYRRYGDRNNFPADLWYSDKEVAQHDAIRQQEMQKAQVASQAPQNMQAAVEAAKTLSETQLPGGNSALGALTGQGG